MSAGKRVLIGFLSTIAWPVLLVALLVTSGTLIINNLNHAGNLAATVVKEVSTNQSAIHSMVDEFIKSADPKLVTEIRKNRTQIESTIASLGSSAVFEKTVSSTLNKISEAALGGEPSVTVDFAPIANEVATKVNEAAKGTVITKKNLANFKPTVIDLSKQAKTITQVKNSIHMALLIWVLWLLLLIGLYLLTGQRIIRTFGVHFLTIGIIGLLIRFVAPVIAKKIIVDANGALYVQQTVPKILNTLLSPIMGPSIAFVIVGIGLTLFYWRLLKNRPEIA